MTSTLNVKEFQAASGSTFTVTDGNIIVPQTILQVKYFRMDNRVSYTANVSGTGNRIPELTMGFSPKSADSIIYFSFMLNIEANENTIFTIHERQSLVHGENDLWHGITTNLYDADVSSTINPLKLLFWIPAQSTEHRQYALATHSSNGAANTVTFNRTINSTGQDSYENTICTAVIMELSA